MFRSCNSLARWLVPVSGCLAALLCASGSWAQTPVTPPAAKGGVVQRGGSERNLGQWLLRMHEASRKQSYAGTFVVSSAGGAMSSSRIWHACDGDQQVERVDALTGTPRSTFRHNDQVVTFFPMSRQVQTERREALRSFPDLLRTPDAGLADFYSARRLGVDRVAGLEADVVQFEPRDRLRYGYRIWAEKETGLVLKMQTMDSDGRALEQAAFSEVQLDARVSMNQLLASMRNTQGYRQEVQEAVPTSAAAEGWNLKQRVPGFGLLSCVRRPASRTVHWTFSDGLATVSLFVEPVDAQSGQLQEVTMSIGATGLLAGRIQDWWLTVVGEVPPQTLQAFAQSLERAR